MCVCVCVCVCVSECVSGGQRELLTFPSSASHMLPNQVSVVWSIARIVCTVLEHSLQRHRVRLIHQ